MRIDTISLRRKSAVKHGKIKPVQRMRGIGGHQEAALQRAAAIVGGESLGGMGEDHRYGAP
jgi:hypothetical protein